MKTKQISKTLLFSISFFFCLLFSTSAQEAINPTVEKFIGRWAMYLPGGAGYIKVHNTDGFVDAEMLWYGGSVSPVQGLFFTEEEMVVTRVSNIVRKRNESGRVERSHRLTNNIKFSPVSEDELKGKAVSVNRDGMSVEITEFTVKRIPDLPERPDLSTIRYGKKKKLFNGKDLSGWELTNPNQKNGFGVSDGVLINKPVHKEGEHGGYGNLRTIDEFEDFKLNIEVNIPAGSNSGIYLRGIYEVQVLDSYGKDLNPHNMGAIYSRITPSVAAEKPAGEWQEMEIILYKRHATVILNGQNIIDNQPLEGVTGGALTPNEFIPGPIYLQGDHGEVSYRNIILTPIKE